MKQFNQVGTVYTCTARVLFDGNQNVTSVYGSHQSGKGNGNVQGLTLSSQDLPFVPTNIQSFFANVLALDLDTNVISSINNKHLKQFPNLQLFSIWKNRITSIDSNLFDGLTSLKFISFDSNDLRHIGHDINIPSNGDMRFAHNPCIDQWANTPGQILNLKLNLLRYCPPKIAQIEETLKNRPFLTNVDGRVNNLIDVTARTDTEVRNLSTGHSSLSTAHTNLSNVVQNLSSKTNGIDQDVNSLLNIVSDLGNRNTQLETRVAFLEALIENLASKLGIKVADTMSEN